MLSEKTKDIGEVAYTLAVEGRVAPLTALLMVAAEKVNGSVLEVRNNTDLAVEKMTVYSCVIKEAVAIFIRNRGKQRVSEESKNEVVDVGEKKRKILLKEMELLHFFGASAANTGCLDKKATSPLIIASQVSCSCHVLPRPNLSSTFYSKMKNMLCIPCSKCYSQIGNSTVLISDNFLRPFFLFLKAGDEAVMKLLLQTDINIGDTDAEGNSALHWCLKASKVSTPEHLRYAHKSCTTKIFYHR